MAQDPPFSRRMLDWYDRHARALPWRVPPEQSKNGVRGDPYHIWMSEVMLQQTTVATVKGYFDKFITRWPSVSDLAAATQDDVMAEWAGLGYYSRARNLKACADAVMSKHGGEFPQDRAALKALPGIGDYTSASIAAIAFGKAEAVVDGNIERVSLRHMADDTPLPKGKEEARAFMSQHTPKDRPGDFVQAMMDLGATICTPKSPACALCPVMDDCLARQQGTMLGFPVKLAKKAKPTRRGAVYIIENEAGSIWLVRRPDKGLLGGMASLPSTDWNSRKDGSTGTHDAPAVQFSEGSQWTKQGEVNHTFTHFHLELEVWHGCGSPQSNDGWWAALQDIEKEGLPTVMAKAVKLVRIQKG